MKNHLLIKTMLLLCALVVGSNCAWAGDIVGTINFGSASGSTKIQGSSSSGEGTVTYTDTGDDSQGNTWTISTITSRTKSFTQNASYSQVGASDKGVTSITFTTTLSKSQTIKAFNAKFGGFSGTSGTITLKVGDTTVGSGSLSEANDVTVSATNTTTSGTVLTVTITGISNKGVKCYFINYTYEVDTPSSEITFANHTPSVNWPTNTTYTQTANTADGYSSTAGASVTYTLGANSAGATINGSTGEVTFTKGGSVTVTATAAAIDGLFTQSSDSYTLTVNDVRADAELSWSEDKVEILKDASSYTLPTLNNPNGLTITNYTATGTNGLASVTSAGVVTVNTGTVGTATIKAIFGGNNDYKNQTVSYTIEVIDPTVKGSKYNPYTFPEVRAVSTETTINDVYVEGYIVGYANSTYGITTNTTLYANTNLVIADNQNEDDVDKTTPVQLSGSNQTNYGLLGHPGLLGAKVLVKGDITKYFNVSGIKNLDDFILVSVLTPAVSSAGWATYVTPYDLSFTEGDAFAVTSVGSNVTLTSVTNVRQGEPLLLKGAGAKTANVLSVSPAAIENKLAISDGDDGVNDYVLANHNSKVGFYKWTGSALASGKVYLPASEVAGAREFLGFDDEATGITNINSEAKSLFNGDFYNIAGQRVAQPAKGLYIVNGKKVIIK